MRRSAPLVWLHLGWPVEVKADQLIGCLRLLASANTQPLVLRAIGNSSYVDHYLATKASDRRFVSRQLQAAVLGLLLAEVDPAVAMPVVHRAVRLKLSTSRRPLRTDEPEHVSQGLLTALAQAEPAEHVMLQWMLGPTVSAQVVPNQLSRHRQESWPAALVLAAVSPPAPIDAEARTALRNKRSEPGWRAIGRIAVTAQTDKRQSQLIAQVLGALRSAESSGVAIRARSDKPKRLERPERRPWSWHLSLNVEELLSLSSWPLGKTSGLPVRRVGSRALPPPVSVPSSGRIIGRSTWPAADRNIALSTSGSLQHLHVMGPTGVGKSTLLLNLITQDLVAGRGLVVIDPKGDLIMNVLERVPADRVNDIVLLDPTDECPAGINPLSAEGGRSPELVADQLLSVFHGLYAAYWGPRTQDILHASLLTLARVPGMSLVALPLLLTDPAFRRRTIGGVSDPLGLSAFWAGFEAWSDAERTAAIAPVLNKLRPFILRTNLRHVVGQTRPRFDVRQVFTERKVLLVALSKGQLGAEAAGLLGSLVVAEVWQAAMERSGIAPEKRHPVFVFIDEFQDYLHLPTDLADALAQARSYGVGLTLAHQHLHQLAPSVRSAVLANARSRVCFQLPHDDARTVAAGSSLLAPEDFQSLDRFAAYAQVVAEGAVQPWCSMRTEPPLRPFSDPATVRSSSRARFGRPARDVEAHLLRLVGAGRSMPDDLSPRPIGRKMPS